MVRSEPEVIGTQPTCTVVALDYRFAEETALRAAFPSDANVVVLPSDMRGMQALVRSLWQFDNVDTLHIVSHGRPGHLLLGSSEISLASMDPSDAQVAMTLRRCLAPNADVLLYGCSVAQGKIGQAGLSTLADALEVNVAAASHPVGAAAQGGSWQLDAVQGAVKAVPIAAPDFEGLLQLGPCALALKPKINPILIRADALAPGTPNESLFTGPEALKALSSEAHEENKPIFSPRFASRNSSPNPLV